MLGHLLVTLCLPLSLVIFGFTSVVGSTLKLGETTAGQVYFGGKKVHCENAPA